jgi:hypothetical protein
MSSQQSELKTGEFYCHRCEKVVLLKDHAAHKKEHEQLQITGRKKISVTK